jgi:hypothetical protein
VKFATAVHVLMLAVLPTAASSLAILGSDFDKATRVGELDLRASSQLRATPSLPAGRARFMFAVPNYRCSPIRSTVEIVANEPGGVSLKRRFKLSELTWSYGRDGCDAIGYLQVAADSEHSEAASASGLRLRVKRNGTPVTIEVTLADVDESKNRTMHVWIIYGDRVPWKRIYGASGDPTKK